MECSLISLRMEVDEKPVGLFDPYIVVSKEMDIPVRKGR